MDEFKQASLQIQTRLFYEESNLVLLVSLCKDPYPRCKKYMESVVNLIEYMFQLLHSNWGSDNGLVVRRKAKSILG